MPDEKNAVTDRFNFMHKKSLLKLTTYLDLKHKKYKTMKILWFDKKKHCIQIVINTINGKYVHAIFLQQEVY
jgi:hypothetical protein